MQPKTIVRRAAVGGVAVMMAAVAADGPAEAAIDTDSVRLTDNEVDFGGSVYAAGVPVGSGSVQWDIVDGFYTPRLIGTLHINNASGEYVRMHISYWDGGDNLIAVRHSGALHANDNGHDSRPIDLSPADLSQITEVHVCTEISDDGVNYSQVDCTNAIYLY